MWRIALGADIRPVLHAMSPWLRLGLLGGAKWKPRAPYVLHDLLAADTTLRVCELVPTVSAAYGEQLSCANLLTTLPVTVTRGAKGDATWVRSDGLRIVVELASPSHSGSLAKVER